MTVAAAPPRRLQALTEGAERITFSDASLLVLLACNLVSTVGLAGDIARHLQEPDNLEGDFLSSWHLVLYGGVTAVGVWLGVGAIQQGPAFLRAAACTTIGFGLLGAGGVIDALWHAQFGTEANVEALVSPPHLVVFAGLAFLLTSPIVIIWKRPERRLDLVASIVVLTSMVTAVLVTSLFTGFLSPLASGMSLSAGYVEPMVGESAIDYDQVRGLGVVVWTSTMLTAAVVTLLVRFRPTPGLVALSVLACGAPALAITDPVVIRPLVVGYAVAGIAAEVALAVLGRPVLGRMGASITGALLSASLWATSFALLGADGRLLWSEAMWGGSIVLAGMVGAAVAGRVALHVPGAEPEVAVAGAADARP